MENSSRQSQLPDENASNSTEKLEVKVWCTVFAAEAVAIVTGNLLTVIIFARDASVRKPSFYLIVSLALADLFIGLFTMPLWIYHLGLGNLWHPSSSYGKPIVIAFFAFDIFTNLASISNLAAISLERMYATLFPWRHRAASRSHVLLPILVAWTMSAVSSAVYIVTQFVVLSKLGTMYSWVPYLGLLLLVICASYTAILVKMRQGSHRRLDRERKLTITLFIATVLSLIAHLPMAVLGVLYYALGKTINNLSLNVLSFFNFGNSLMNPIIYACRMPDFRRAVCSMFCPQQNRQQTHQGHVTAPPGDNCVSPSPFHFRMATGAPTTIKFPTQSPRAPRSTVAREPSADRGALGSGYEIDHESVAEGPTRVTRYPWREQ